MVTLYYECQTCGVRAEKHLRKEANSELIARETIKILRDLYPHDPKHLDYYGGVKGEKAHHHVKEESLQWAAGI